MLISPSLGTKYSPSHYVVHTAKHGLELGSVFFGRLYHKLRGLSYGLKINSNNAALCNNCSNYVRERFKLQAKFTSHIFSKNANSSHTFVYAKLKVM
jgi:hypothetical protein